MSFFDFDEFLELNNKTIHEYLGNKVFDKCANVKINWLMYSDNELIYYENKSVQERFIVPLFNDVANHVIKSTINCKLKRNYWNGMYNPHCSNNGFRACNSRGNTTNPKAVFSDPANFEKAYLKHYATKSIEEYCNKTKRGRSDTLVVLDQKTLKEYFDYFFLRNKITQEKLDYIEKIFNYTYSVNI